MMKKSATACVAFGCGWGEGGGEKSGRRTQTQHPTGPRAHLGQAVHHTRSRASFPLLTTHTWESVVGDGHRQDNACVHTRGAPPLPAAPLNTHTWEMLSVMGSASVCTRMRRWPSGEVYSSAACRKHSLPACSRSEICAAAQHTQHVRCGVQSPRVRGASRSPELFPCTSLSKPGGWCRRTGCGATVPACKTLTRKP